MICIYQNTRCDRKETGLKSKKSYIKFPSFKIITLESNTLSYLSPPHLLMALTSRKWVSLMKIARLGQPAYLFDLRPYDLFSKFKAGGGGHIYKVCPKRNRTEVRKILYQNQTASFPSSKLSPSGLTHFFSSFSPTCLHAPLEGVSATPSSWPSWWLPRPENRSP